MAFAQSMQSGPVLHAVVPDFGTGKKIIERNYQTIMDKNIQML